jgi:hypothetical protein
MSRRNDTAARYRKMLAMVPAKQRRALALGFSVRLLDLLSEVSMLPTQVAMAGGLADAIRDLVPADVRAALAAAYGEDQA